jgi:site-specific DNA recombinase
MPVHPNWSERTSPETWILIPVPALVSPALFEAVGEQLKENAKRARQGRRPPVSRLLSGLVVCARCGYAYLGHTTHPKRRDGTVGEYGYYRCGSEDLRRRTGDRLCENGSVSAERLEEAVWADVCSLLSEPERLEQEYQRRLAPRGRRRAFG